MHRREGGGWGRCANKYESVHWKQLTKVLCTATEGTFSLQAKIQGDDKSQDEHCDEEEKFDEPLLYY